MGGSQLAPGDVTGVEREAREKETETGMMVGGNRGLKRVWMKVLSNGST